MSVRESSVNFVNLESGVMSLIRLFVRESSVNFVNIVSVVRSLIWLSERDSFVNIGDPVFQVDDDLKVT